MAGRPRPRSGGRDRPRPARETPRAGRIGRTSQAEGRADAERAAEPFRLGAVPGATPGKWISIWRQRMPHVPLELIETPVRDQREALISGAVDAALVRLPLETSGLHVIRLYDEIPVVVVSAESALTIADELDAADLAGEVLIVPDDDVLHLQLPGTLAPAFAPPADTKSAIELVASGIGVAVVPMSLARLHHRRDVTHRALVGGPVSTIALAWPADRTTPEIDTFVGIVRGRGANSSRS